MRKLFFVAALGVAGVMSASGNGHENIQNQENVINIESKCKENVSRLLIRGEILTWSVSYTDCSGNIIYDTLSWEEGNMDSYWEMIECDANAAEAWASYNCP